MQNGEFSTPPIVEIVKNTNNQELNEETQVTNFSENILEESQSSSQVNIGFENTEDLTPFPFAPLEVHHQDFDISKNVHLGDPGTWPSVSDKFCCFLVESGPEQDSRDSYPSAACGTGKRQFSKNWFQKVRSTGEKTNRQWLLYGKS